ncbi:hypothetical protein, partial [Paenibacillus sp. DMB5]|uniref:leucine-rich repeat domain-containing protein n=1 Tax=Paenibacillus sp. DMB5 TaxID=1780103 RepID=UPI000ABDE530
MRIVSILLVTALLLTSSPIAVLAAGGEENILGSDIKNNSVSESVYARSSVTDNVYESLTALPQEAMDNFNKGDSVVIKYLFEDQNLAEYFVQWLKKNGWSGDMDSALNKEELKTMNMGYPFDASGKGIKSLIGMQVFNTYTGIPTNLNFSGNLLTSVEGLEGFEYASSLDLSQNMLINVDGLRNLKSVVGLYLYTNKLTSVQGLRNLKYVRDRLYLQNNNLISLDGLDGIDPSRTSEFGQDIYSRSFDFSQNRLTDISGINQLTRIGTLDLNSNNLMDLTALSNLQSVTSLLDVSSNKLTSLEGLDKSLVCKYFKDFGNYISDPLTVPFSVTSFIPDYVYPQNGFQFKQNLASNTVTVDYREAGSDRLLASNMISNIQSGIANTYFPEEISGYKVVDPMEQTVEFLNSYSQPDIYKVLLNSAGATKPRKDSISNYSLISNDPEVLAFDESRKYLSAVGTGKANVSVYQNGVFLGSYTPDIVKSDLNNTKKITFYYKKVEPFPVSTPVPTDEPESSPTPAPTPARRQQHRH